MAAKCHIYGRLQYVYILMRKFPIQNSNYVHLFFSASRSLGMLTNYVIADVKCQNLDFNMLDSNLSQTSKQTSWTETSSSILSRQQ